MYNICPAIPPTKPPMFTAAPGFMNSGFGRGFSRGRGFAWRARAMQAVPMQQVQPTVTTEKKKTIFSARIGCSKRRNERNREETKRT